MATTRLNAEMRTQMLKLLIGDRFKKQHEANEKERAEIALECHETWHEQELSIEERELLKSLPEGWCIERGHVTIVYQGSYYTLEFFPEIFVGFDPGGSRREGDRRWKCDYEGRKKNPVLRRLAPTLAYKRFELEVRSALGKRFAKHLSLRKELVEQEEEMRFQTRVALNKHRTYESLIKCWPEVEPIATKVLNTKQQIVGPPALTHDSLNKLLGLGKD